VLFEGINPCQRCVVPRNSITGGSNFQKCVVTRRREYRPGQLQLVLIILQVGVNMRVPESQAGRFYDRGCAQV